MGDIFPDYKGYAKTAEAGVNKIGNGFQQMAQGAFNMVLGHAETQAAAIGAVAESTPAVIVAKGLYNENKERLGGIAAGGNGVLQEVAKVPGKMIDHVKNKPFTSAAESFLPSVFIADALTAESDNKGVVAAAGARAAAAMQEAAKAAIQRQAAEDAQKQAVQQKKNPEINPRVDHVDAKPEFNLNPEKNTKPAESKPQAYPKLEADYSAASGKPKGGAELDNVELKQSELGKAKSGPPRRDGIDGAVAESKSGPKEDLKKGGDANESRSRHKRKHGHEQSQEKDRGGIDATESEDKFAKQLKNAVEVYESSLKKSLPDDMKHMIPELSRDFKAKLQAQRNLDLESKNKTKDLPKSPLQLEAEQSKQSKQSMPLEKAPAVSDKLSPGDYEAAVKKFPFNESTYSQALAEAAEKGKPVVLIGGTKDSSAKFMQAAQAQAAAGDAVYVFVSRDKLNDSNALAQYLDKQIRPNGQTKDNNDYCWTSVFRVNKDASGGVVISAPDYAKAGANSIDSAQIRNSVETIGKINDALGRHAQVKELPTAQPYYSTTYEQPTMYQPAQIQYQQPVYQQPRGLGIFRRR